MTRGAALAIEEGGQTVLIPDSEGGLARVNLETGLRATGMDDADVAKIMGGNWYRFFAENFGPAG